MNRSYLPATPTGPGEQIPADLLCIHGLPTRIRCGRCHPTTEVLAQLSPQRVLNGLLCGFDCPAESQEVVTVLHQRAPAFAPAVRAADLVRRRAVATLVSRSPWVGGVLELGAGFPDEHDNYVEIQARLAGLAMVRVQHDPVIAAHGRALLETSPASRYWHADHTDPTVATAAIAHFGRTPIVVDLAPLLLESITDAAEYVRAAISVLASGSYVVLTHLSADHDPATAEAAARTYSDTEHRHTAGGATDPAHRFALHPRTAAQITAMLTGADPLGPGLALVGDLISADDAAEVHSRRPPGANPPPADRRHTASTAAPLTCCYAAIARIS
ncbi:SAM-dependent methyltransferase [Nocardia takedensis]|uniref:SAM-dependent methyltransferase n=1 Tax=Nocardia takedensis TaxID=259390 RepID=UPI0002DD2A4B|nr:SAM-dependent methyltransferase [Nocardia takedensis]